MREISVNTPNVDCACDIKHSKSHYRIGASQLPMSKPVYPPIVARKAITLARSSGFLRPEKLIFVPFA